MHSEEFSFLSLLLITALAAFVPLLASRLRRFRVPIIAVSTYDETNLEACRLAHEKFDVPLIIAQTSDSVVAAELSNMGVRVVHP